MKLFILYFRQYLDKSKLFTTAIKWRIIGIKKYLCTSYMKYFQLHENIFVYNKVIIWSCKSIPHQMYRLPQSIVIQISSFQKSPGISILTIFPIKYHVIKRWEELNWSFSWCVEKKGNGMLIHDLVWKLIFVSESLIESYLCHHS